MTYLPTFTLDFTGAPDRTKTPNTALAGVAAGGSVAGLLTSLFLAVGVFPLTRPEPPAEWAAAALGALGAFILADVLASVCWAVGISILGGPIWAILNALGVRGWSSAVLIGAVISPAPFLLLNTGDAVDFISLAFIGGTAALVAWLIAYRQPMVGARV